LLSGSQGFNDRLVLRKDPDVMGVLGSILRGANDEISSIYGGTRRAVNYVVMDNIVNNDTIRRLIAKDIMTVSSGRKLSTCPVCGSSDFNVFLLCPVHHKSVFREELVGEGAGY